MCRSDNLRNKVVEREGCTIGLVANTLFSGDPLTQLMKTLMNLVLAYSVIGESGEASIKGDDAVIMSNTEDGASDYVQQKSENGGIIAKDKTMISHDAVQMEPCEVGVPGFHSSILRKVGFDTNG